MIGFFKSILSNKSIVESASRGIDNVFLTDEEKTKYFLEYLTASMPMNVSRRFIAIVVTCFWLLVGVIQVTLILMGSGLVEEMHSFATVYVMPPFTLLTAFYFMKKLVQK